MKTLRQKLIRREVLKTLDNAAPWLIAESTVLASVYLGLDLKPAVVQSEIEAVIAHMESNREVYRMLGDGEEMKIKITDQGKAALLQ